VSGGLLARLREWSRGDWSPPGWYVALTAVAVVVSLLVSLAGLSGCRLGNNFDDPPAGVVVSRDKDLINNVASWAVFVDPDGVGEREKVFVDRSVFAACQVGARWPDCRDGAR